jgi:hypothetical protein
MNGSDDYDRAKHAEPTIGPLRTRRWVAAGKAVPPSPAAAGRSRVPITMDVLEQAAPLVTQTRARYGNVQGAPLGAEPAPGSAPVRDTRQRLGVPVRS